MIKLSICIPTRNRSNTLFTNLKRICKYSNTNSQFIEVVIGDNSDKSSIKSVKEIFKDHSEIKFNYIYNSTNIGLARNYLNIVKNALGEFCWILGDDDFIKENSISTLLKIIDSKKYDLIAFNYEVIKIIKDDNPSVISKKIELKKDMYSNEKFGKSFKSNNFFDLISYKFNNVY